MVHVKEIMTDNVVTVTPTCLLYDAVERLLEHRVSGLPVVEADDRLVGIISEFALLVLTYDREAQHDTVAQHMTRQVMAVDENTLLSDVADMFILNRFRRVPVTRQGKLVGIVSRRDLMRAAHHHERAFARPEVLAQQRGFRKQVAGRALTCRERR